MIIKFFSILLLLPMLAQAGSFTVEEAASGIYVHHGQHLNIEEGYGGDICNISFIVGQKGVAVVDSGGSPKVGAQLRAEIRKVTDLPILYVINTHFHPDHVFGNAAFTDDHPVFIGHERLAAGMAQRRDAYLKNQPSWVGADATGSELIAPMRTISGTQLLDLGGRFLELTAQNTAHTTSDLTVYDTATATLFTGDLLFVERTPSVDGDVRGWLTVIEQMKHLPAIRAVPGHGPVVTDWRGAFDDEKFYLSGLLETVRSAIREGRSMEQTIAASKTQTNWVLYDVVNRRNISLLFPALEWE